MRGILFSVIEQDAIGGRTPACHNALAMRLARPPDPIRPGSMSEPTARSLPIIRGERVYLRPAERTDIPTFVRWFTDAETLSFVLCARP